FSHEHARYRAYRWNEDGLLGISDRHQRICFALALWNGHDPILKERLYGFTGNEGNHGEDVKEYYFYLDSTPTHSYMKSLYKYPQAAFPYAKLLEENARRGRLDPEYELADTGIFAENRYFDVLVEYAKNTPEDILIRITVSNRGPDPATLEVLPTVWFRNTWSWGCGDPRPSLRQRDAECVQLDEPYYGKRWLFAETNSEWLFTENESNAQRLWKIPNGHSWVKDAMHDYIVRGCPHCTNPAREGTKAAARHRLSVAPGESEVIRL